MIEPSVQQDDLNISTPSTPNNFNALSLSGGGYCGLFTSRVLEQLEKKYCETNKLNEYMNLVSGTSIGGIIAIAVAAGIDAKTIRIAIESEGKNIFNKVAILGLWKSRYRSEQLRSTIVNILGNEDLRMGDIKCPLLVPALNLSTGQAEVFHSNVMGNEYEEFKLVDIALATSAAPVYFPVHRIDRTMYVDGGLIANSPDMVSLNHILQSGVDIKCVKMLCIGTTKELSGQANQSKLNKGAAYWFSKTRIIDAMMRGQESLTEQICESLLDIRYTWINETQSANHSKILGLDKVDDNARDTLIALADSAYMKRSKDITSMFNHTRSH
jgi:predicted patatin/cPLA2 family phospholipase